MNDFCRKILFFSAFSLIRIFWLIKLFCISINLTLVINRNQSQFEKVGVAVNNTELFVLLLEYCLVENGCITLILRLKAQIV